MATIYHNETKIEKDELVAQFLASKQILFKTFALPETLHNLLKQESLSDPEKDEVLLGLEYRFDQLKKEQGYRSRDLVVLHNKVPGIEEMLAKFDKLHYHTDEEVRYIIDGTGIFGFSIARDKFEVHVKQGDFISIPQNTHHWFALDKSRRIKAVRYFKDNSGWTPVYVEEKLAQV